MSELIGNAVTGWKNYTEAGKLAALLLIGLLFFWFERKELKDRYLTLILYTTGMAVCCILPPTAAVLMQYQTRFYDYRWIWNLVPVTIVIALAGTVIWFELTGKYTNEKGGRWKRAGITVTMIAVVYLCGSLGDGTWNAEEESLQLEETAKVLEIITKNGENTDITLWAPQGIMEYARAWSGNIRLPYGRNMWDAALNAYSYDTYGSEENILYAWMCNAEDSGDTVISVQTDRSLEETDDGRITGKECMQLAKQLGVTHILLPESMPDEKLEKLSNFLKVEAENVEGYYLFRVGE